MDARGRLARDARLTIRLAGDAPADGVIEDHYPLTASRLRNQSLGFGVVDTAELFRIGEVRNRTAMIDQREPLSIERHFRSHRPHVVNADRVRSMRGIYRAAGLLESVGARFLCRRFEIVEDTLDMRKGRDHTFLQAHDTPSW